MDGVCVPVESELLVLVAVEVEMLFPEVGVELELEDVVWLLEFDVVEEFEFPVPEPVVFVCGATGLVEVLVDVEVDVLFPDTVFVVVGTSTTTELVSVVVGTSLGVVFVFEPAGLESPPDPRFAAESGFC